MKVINTVKDLKSELSEIRKQGKKIGLVPTMGALHQGHASLVKRSVSENDATVVSVFVNPTQFNDKNDLKNYPRTLEADCKLLESLGATYVFAPSVEEIYPEPDTRSFSYPPVDTVMEGARRPGHFNGVCQIVSKLFMMVEPDRAYFGEKDFQQIAVIRAMVADQKFNLEICPCPIVREADGLAKSSRNTYLNPEEHKAALILSRAVRLGQKMVEEGEKDTGKIVEAMKAEIGTEPLAVIDYVDAVDMDTLEKTERVQGTVLVAMAVYIGKTRLIDNFIVEEEK